MIKFGVVILAAMATASAFAQSFESDGKGDFTQGRDKREIRDAEVVFTRSTFTLSLGFERGRQVVVEGNITKIGDRRNVEVTSIDGSRSEGKGYILIERDRLKTVDIFGDPSSGRYSLKFRSEERDNKPPTRPPSGSGRIEASGDTTGDGRYRLGRDESDVKKVTFTLRENGFLSLTIDFKRGRDVTYTGRWTGKGDTRKFTLDGGWGKRISGSGEFHLSDDRNEIRTLNFSGKVDDDRLTFNFKDK